MFEFFCCRLSIRRVAYRSPYRCRIPCCRSSVLLIAGLIYTCVRLSTLSMKGAMLLMSTHTAPIEASADAGAGTAHRPDRKRGLCLALCRAETEPVCHRS